MKITLHHCDMCKAEVAPKDLYTFEIRARTADGYGAVYSTLGSMDICRACTSANGYMNVAAEGVRPPDPAPSIEERLTSILTQFVNLVVDER